MQTIQSTSCKNSFLRSKIVNYFDCHKNLSVFSSVWLLTTTKFLFLILFSHLVSLNYITLHLYLKYNDSVSLKVKLVINAETKYFYIINLNTAFLTILINSWKAWYLYNLQISVYKAIYVQCKLEKRAKLKSFSIQK